MKKRTLSFLLALVMCLSLLPMTALAAGDTLKDIPIPKPAAPNYFMTDVASENWHGYIRIVTLFDNSMLALVSEHDIDEEAFYAKYGIANEYYYDFRIKMQYDVNVDGRGWQYTPEWDELDGYTGAYDVGYDQNYLHDDLVSEFTLVDLLHEESRALYGNMAYLSHQSEWGEDVWRFDLTNHSVQVRCRYYMEYYDNDEQMIRIGDWSDIAVIGKGSTQRVPTQPTSYAAPVISNMRVVPPEGYQTEAHVYFEMDTPDSVWDAEVYYAMHDERGFDELDAQINVNGGGWETVYVGNSHWPLYEGDRQSATTKSITEESHVQLRVRYGGPLGYSDWSNILEVNAPEWDASDWAQPYVQQAAELGLIPEVLEGADMSKPITRLEFAAVAVKTYEAISGTAALPAITNPFTDTDYIEVLKAYNLGVTNGTSATTFSPDVLLNREQMATMLTRVFQRSTIPGWPENNPPLEYTKPAPFADDKDISDWAKDCVYFMAANGIIAGVGNNTFAPKAVTTEQQATGYAQATREQALTIAVRMVENFGK